MMLIKLLVFLRNILLNIRDFIFIGLKVKGYNKSWRFWGLPDINICKKSRITFGNKFVACSLSKRNEIGVSQKVVIKTVRPYAEIIIGDNVGVSGATISAAKLIRIGNDVLIGSGVLIIDNDAHSTNILQRFDKNSVKALPVIIGDSVFIGAKAIILKGVTLGDNCIVGAGSVVTKSFPPNSVIVGNPAKALSVV